ncbi:MAG: ParB/RepB/Spo0J family partition protein [Chloroflexi bacterium]|nr:MAG: ParB/RepB/Spo0J family partition protein [Chloroflexota bacterium]
MARTGLGRGLDVLLGQPPHADAPLGLTSASTEIPLEKVMPNRQQPRTSFDPEGLSELAASIRQHGVLQPIVVSRDGDGYELIAGHRRVLAARLAGRTSIPAVVRDEAGDRLELALVENLQRADLNAIEAARGYKLLMETYDLTQEQLAERLGKSRSAIANTLRTLSAPQPLQDAVLEGRIGEGHLRQDGPSDPPRSCARAGSRRRSRPGAPERRATSRAWDEGRDPPRTPRRTDRDPVLFGRRFRAAL